MKSQADLKKRLLFILHRGFSEARLLAQGDKCQQLFDLADAMEVLPKFVEACSEEDYELIRFVLKNYQDKYPENRFDHLAYLEQHEPPERY